MPAHSRDRSFFVRSMSGVFGDDTIFLANYRSDLEIKTKPCQSPRIPSNHASQRWRIPLLPRGLNRRSANQHFSRQACPNAQAESTSSPTAEEESRPHRSFRQAWSNIPLLEMISVAAYLCSLGRNKRDQSRRVESPSTTKGLVRISSLDMLKAASETIKPIAAWSCCTQRGPSNRLCSRSHRMSFPAGPRWNRIGSF